MVEVEVTVGRSLATENTVNVNGAAAAVADEFPAPPAEPERAAVACAAAGL